MHVSPAGRMLVLVVDDDEAIRRVLVRELSRDFDSILAGGYDEALSALRDRGPHLAAVVTDKHLGPGCSGLDLLEAVRREQPSCVRIMVSGEMDDELEARLASDGLADAAFRKPWPLHSVASVLTSLLARRGRVSA